MVVTMGRKALTQEYIEDQFALSGYTLLSKYVKSYKKLDFICDNDHEHSMTWDNFRSGYRCGVCSGHKVTHEQVNQAFNDAGYKLLSTYKNNKIQLKFICSKGHEHSIPWTSFQQGDRCGICSGRYLTHDQINQSFDDAGYILLSKYENCHTKLKFICPKGHEHSIGWNSFQQGQRCGICYTSNQNKNPGNNIAGRIKNSISKQLKRENKAENENFKWSDIYAYESFQKLAEQLKEFYDDCPQGSHVDHIIPCSFFDFWYSDQLKACWDIRNLRYLKATENISRGNKLTKADRKYIQENISDIYELASNKP